MDSELLEELKRQIPGCSITLRDSTKRCDGEWHARWTFSVTDCNGRILFESAPWFGYKTVNEALFAMSGCLEHYTRIHSAKESAKS